MSCLFGIPNYILKSLVKNQLLIYPGKDRSVVTQFFPKEFLTSVILAGLIGLGGQSPTEASAEERVPTLYIDNQEHFPVVNEGNSFTVTIKSTYPVDHDLLVNIHVAGFDAVQDRLAVSGTKKVPADWEVGPNWNGNQHTTAVLLAGEQETEVLFRTIDDNIINDDSCGGCRGHGHLHRGSGYAHVYLLDGEGYEPHEFRHFISVQILDDDYHLPEVFMHAAKWKVNYPDPAEYVLHFNPKPTRDMVIYMRENTEYGLIANNHYGTVTEFPESVRVPLADIETKNGQHTYRFSIPTNKPHRDGSRFSMTVAPSIHYIVNPNLARRAYWSWPSIFVVNSLVDGFVRKISISRITEAEMVEGGTAGFRLYGGRNDTIDINVTVSDGSGDFLLGTPTSMVRSIREVESFLFIRTHDDNVDEEDGTITVTVNEGDGYEPRRDFATASVRVLDNDPEVPVDELPTLSLSSIAKKDSTGSYSNISDSAVDEGEIIEFTVTSDVSFLHDVVVNLKVEQVGNAISGMLDWEDSPNPPIVMKAGRHSATYSVATADDWDFFATGTRSVTVSLLPDLHAPARYVVGGTDKRVVEVRGIDIGERVVEDRENDIIVEASITAVAEEVPESGTAEFRVTSSETVARDLTVALSVEVDDQAYIVVSPIGDHSVTIAAGEDEAVLTLVLDNDVLYEYDDVVTVRVVEGTGYVPATGDDGSATIRVTDDDVRPVASITRGGASITEGKMAEFTVTLNKPAGMDFNVIVSFNDGEHDFLADWNNPMERPNAALDGFTGVINNAYRVPLLFLRGESSYTVRIPTMDDDVVESEGTITAVVAGERDRYTVAPAPDDRAHVTVLDNDSPKVEIVTYNSTVAESGTAQFTIRSSVAVDEALTVNLNVEVDDRAYIVVSPIGDHSVTIAAGEDEAVLTLVLDNDLLYEYDDVVTARVVEGAGYVPATGDDGSATIRVTDDDVRPVASITRGGASITEGEMAEFTVTLDKPPGILFFVSVEFNDGEHDFLADWANRTVRPNAALDDSTGEINNAYIIGFGFTPGEGNYANIHTVRIPTLDDDAVENEGTITARIVEMDRFGLTPAPDDFAYTVAPAPDDSAHVTVLDNDAPEVEIVTYNSTVAESGTAQFTIRSSEAVDEALTVNLNVEVENRADIVVSPIGDHSVTIAAGENEAVLTLVLDDDEIYEYDELVTAGVVEGTGYVPVTGDNSSATIRVTDDDVRPVASIARGGGTITEGEAAEFTVTLNKPAGMNFNVIVEFKDYEHDFLADWNNPTERPNAASDGLTGVINNTYRLPLPFLPGESSHTVWIPTLDDDAVEREGLISAAIVWGREHYGVAPAPDDIDCVFVLDNDTALPEISIESVLDSVVEGKPAKFLLTSSSDLASDLRVKVRITQNGNFLKKAERTRWVAFNSDTESKRFREQTVNDNVDELDGTVRAKVLPGPGYSVAASAEDRTATVAVVDNDGEAMPVISIAAEAGEVAEGGVARFEVTVVPAPEAGSAVTVDIAVVDRRDRKAKSRVRTVTVGLTGSGILAYDVADNNRYESRSTITATVVDAERYSVSETEGSANVEVIDDEAAPVISVKAVTTDGVVEGSPVWFMISATRPSAVDRSIEVTLSDGDGDFLAPDGAPEVTLWAFYRKVFVTVGTVDDDADEADGRVSLTVGPGTGYTVAAAPRNAASVDVRDNDAAVPVVSVERTVGRITEGAAAAFTLRTSVVSSADLSVNIGVTVTGDFVQGTLPTSVEIESGRLTVPLSVATIDDSVDEPNGLVAVGVLAGEGYTAATGDDGTAEVEVADDDTVPEVSLGVVPGPVTEGGRAGFTVSADAAVDFPLTVGVRVAVAHGGLTSVSERVVTIGSGENSAEFEVALPNDEFHGTTMTVTASLDEGRDYSVDALGRTRTVEVADDDPAPIVSIEGYRSSVTEGSPVWYKVSSTHSSAVALTIGIAVTEEGGNYLASPAPASIELVRYHRLTYVSLETDDDDAVEADGTVWVELQSGAGYEVSASDGRAGVGVLDNDLSLPVVSIEAESDAPIEEGGIAWFRVRASEAPTTRLTVRVSVSEDGNYMSDQVPVPTDVTIYARTSFAWLLVLTENDLTPEADGSVAVEVVDGEGYVVAAADENRAVVEVVDNDAELRLPEVSVSAVASSVVEGSGAEFTVMLTERVDHELFVNLDVYQTGDFFDGTVYERVELKIGDGEISELLPRATINDDVEEADGQVTVFVRADDSEGGGGATYRVDTDADYDSVDVKDDDDTTVISVREAVTPVTEGTVVRFELASTKTLLRDRTVNIGIEETGAAIVGVAPRYAVLPAGRNTVEVEIPTVDDGDNEAKSRITLTLQGGTGYVVAAVPDDSGHVDVTDNDQVRLGLIFSQSGGDSTDPRYGATHVSWSEGLPALVHINTLPIGTTVNRDLKINFTATDTGGKLVNSGGSSVVLEAGSSRVSVKLPTTCNQAGEPTSVLTVQLEPGEGYEVVGVGENPHYGASQTRPIPDVNISSQGITTCPVPNDISISAVYEEITAGNNAQFELTGTYLRGGHQWVNVRIANEKGDFLAEQTRDFPVQISAGAYSAVFSVRTRTSETADSGEIAAWITEGDNYVAGSPAREVVRVTQGTKGPEPSRSAALHREVLPQLLGTTGANSAEALSARVDFAFENPGETRFELGGASTVEDMVTRSGGLLNEDGSDLGAFLSDSSFAVPLVPDQGAGTAATFWGEGLNVDVADTRGGSSLDWQGESFTGRLGLDARIGGGLLAGVVASSSDSSVDFTLGDAGDELAGAYRVRMTSMQPYLAWASADLGTRLRGGIGYGLGEVGIDYEGYAAEVAELSELSAVFGGSDRLYSTESLFGGGPAELTFRAEGWAARQAVTRNGRGIAGATVGAHSMRIATEGSMRRDLVSGASLNPVVSVGTRWDGGGGNAGLGMEVAGGVDYADPRGIEVSGSGGILYLDDPTGLRRGLEGRFTYDADADGIGLTTTVSPAWGTTDGFQEFWNRETTTDSSSLSGGGISVESEIGYGFAAADGLGIATPYAYSGLDDGSLDSIGIGGRMTTGSGNAFSIEAGGQARSNGKLGGRMNLESSIKW